MVKKLIRDFELRNVSPDDYINQAKGLKLVKERKRQEQKQINTARFAQVTRTKTSKLNKDMIKRGYNIAEKWKDEKEKQK